MGLAVGLLNELPLHLLAQQCEVGSAALVCPCCPDDGADGVPVFDSGVEGLDDQDAEAFTSPIERVRGQEKVAASDDSPLTYLWMVPPRQFIPRTTAICSQTGDHGDCSAPILMLITNSKE